MSLMVTRLTKQRRYFILSGSYARYKLGLHIAHIESRNGAGVVEFLHTQTINLPPAPKHVHNHQLVVNDYPTPYGTRCKYAPSTQTPCTYRALRVNKLRYMGISSHSFPNPIQPDAHSMRFISSLHVPGCVDHNQIANTRVPNATHTALNPAVEDGAALPKAGATVCDGPAEGFEPADTVFVMVGLAPAP